MPTTIVVSGLGAMGGYYGGMLAHFTSQLTHYRVFFFMRQGEHMQVVSRHGLKVLTPSIDIVARPTAVVSDATELPIADILILATKGYDLKQNLKQLSPCIDKHTLIVTTQNGLSAVDVVREQYPRNIIIPAACHITGRKTDSGIIEMRSDSNVLKLGYIPELQHITPKVRERTEIFYILLKAAGVKCNLYENMGPLLREKFIMLSPSAAATTYFDAPIGVVMEEHEKELRALIHELAQLYRSMGIMIDLFMEENAYMAIGKMPKEATTSMHSDVSKGHKSELEILVGYVVKMAKKHNLLVPYYSLYYEEIKKRIRQRKAKEQ